MKTVWVLRHLAFEDLGILESIFLAHKFSIRYIEAGVGSFDGLDSLAPDLLVILGGPIGVYEEDDYPFLRKEFAWVKQRIQAKKPTLGICLGAQIIAHVLGAKVYPGAVKEIGWVPLKLTPEGEKSYLCHLDPNITKVLSWHGDTYDLPSEAICLASTAAYEQQAFSWANHQILGVQFHPEINPMHIERWLIGHTVEINKTSTTSVKTLRADTLRYGQTSAEQGRLFFEQWVDFIFGEK